MATTMTTHAQHPAPPAPATAGAAVPMTAGQFERLQKIIYERSGIRFQDAKKYILETRLARRLEELEMDSFDDYISFLTIGPYRDDEFQEMFNRVTINETSFFRNEPQLEVFEKQVLPRLLEARKGAKRLRIWSAACSSGEEPYTLGILVHRTLGLRLADWRVEILGTDISDKVLATAQSGRFTQYAIRATPALVQQRYFKQEPGFHVIDPVVKSMVAFERLNLKDRLAIKRHGLWDVIFCRNVMIYFDRQMRQDLVCAFGESLADDGALFIGHSETLHDLAVPFEPTESTEGFCYRKTGKVAPPKV